MLDGELVVVNDTRVVPARLRLRRQSGGTVEVLLVEALGDGAWEALVRPSSRMRVGEELGPVTLQEPLGAGRWRVEVAGQPAGEMPLPPYIHEPLGDPERYQTVYATCGRLGRRSDRRPPSHARPSSNGSTPLAITLHVGLDTFRPVTEGTLEEHAIHGERYEVAGEAWERISAAQRVLAVGTTTVRALEAVAGDRGADGTDDAVHRPRLRVSLRRRARHELPPAALDAARARDGVRGVEETRRIYQEAIAERYRFYSFGDAMAVL